MPNPFAKQSAEPYEPSVSREMADFSNDLKTEAIRRALESGSQGLHTGYHLTRLLARASKERQLRPKIPKIRPEIAFHTAEPDERKPAAKDAGYVSSALAAGTLGAGLGHYRGRRKAHNPLEGGHHGAIHGAIHGVLRSVPATTASNLVQALMGPGNEALGSIAGLLAAGGTDYLTGHLSEPLASHITEQVYGPAPPAHGQAHDEGKKKDEKDEKKDEKKAAERPFTTEARRLLDSLGLATQAGEPAPPIGSLHWLRGDTQTSLGAIPWALPAEVVASIGGLAGGHYSAKDMLQKQRKLDIEKELQQAQREYDEALQTPYVTAATDGSRAKHASDDAPALETVLDACFHRLEKRGFFGVDLNDLAGRGTAAYLTLASLLAGTSGLGTYKFLRGRDPSKLLEEAAKRRALIRNLQNPPEVFIDPPEEPEEEPVSPDEPEPDDVPAQRAKL
jgi:hypothetical protein